MMPACFEILGSWMICKITPFPLLVRSCACMGIQHTHLQAPFRDARLTPAMEAYNLAMSRVRTSVEWIFGDAIKSFKALDFKGNLKIGLSRVGKMYVVCALMRNAITCMYGNQTCDFFGLEPPTINEYFS